MLYIYYGTDEVVARDKVKRLLSGLQKKAPDAELVRVTGDSDASVDIDGLLATQGLFKQNYLLYLDGVDDVILGFSDIQLTAMKQTGHICIALMSKLTVKQKTLLEKYAQKIVECTLPKNKKKSRTLNVFDVASALKDRSKLRLWQKLVEARLEGSEGVALTGMLFWAVKDMLLKRQLRNYTEQELKTLVVKLAALPHKARIDAMSIHNALEKFALSTI